MVAVKPLMIGALMGLIMLWMLHGQLTNESTISGPALIVFVGAHLALLIIAIGGGLLAARLSPATRKWLARLHRPSMRHFGLMLAGAITSTGLVHVSLHGLA